MIEGIYLLLGTNLGDKKKQLRHARKAINKDIGSISRASSIYKTAAWGKEDQPAFLNQVIKVKSDFSPFEILEKIGAIEKRLGRVRVEKWGERQIDIDILYYDSEVVNTPELSIPHPGIPDRRFTLAPLVEIAPDFKHPVLKKTNQKLLKLCSDPLRVSKEQ